MLESQPSHNPGEANSKDHLKELVSESLSSHPPPTGGLGTLGFWALLTTQFFTAVNDNIFRWLVMGLGKDHVPPEQVSNVLTIGMICFVAPYLVLAAPAGFLADRYRKRSVIVACKVAEIVLMALGLGAVMLGGSSQSLALGSLFAVLTLMGAQSALFAPSRAGILPEVVRPQSLTAANGLFSLATVLATVVGMVVGCWLADAVGDKGLARPWLAGLVIIGTAVVGTLTSLPIPSLPAGNPSLPFRWGFLLSTWDDLKLLYRSQPLFRVALGIMFFYAIGSIAQMNIDQMAQEGGAIKETAKTPLLISLIAGVCVGSLLAGFWSGDHVELGLLPCGALGMAVGSMLLWTTSTELFTSGAALTPGLVWACLLLVFLGGSAGLFDVPLEAFLQQRSPRESRGSILAAANFLTFSGILLASLLFGALRYPTWEAAGKATADPLLSARGVFLFAGALTIPVLIYIVTVIPQATIRFVVWLLSMTIYRIRIFGRENLPREGGALLVPNHITWVDGILLVLGSSRPIRMVALSTNLENRWLKWLADIFGVIPINPAKPKMVITAFRTAREALNNGELVCIFPEGGLTRSGQVQAFRPGVMKILDGTQVPIVPVYLEGLWGSIFSFEGGKFFWKWPKRIPYPLSIHFGPPLAQATHVHELRQAVVQLGASAVQQSADEQLPISRTFIRRCKERLKKPKVADTLGGELSGGDVLARALVLRRLLLRHVLAKDEKYVGLLLPPSAPGFLANMAVALDRRIAINLNYTVSEEVMNECIRIAGIKHVLTSRRFMDKLNLKLNAEVVYLEDLKDKPTLLDKAAAGLATYVLPAWWVERSLGLHHVKPDDVLTVIFTSGSTGTPKGVMLTYRNVGTNVEAIEQCVHIKNTDVLMGVLPFFHSFGYTVTMWGVAGLNIQGVYHFSPLDAKIIGKLCEKFRGTLLLATPTFLRTYLRRVEKEEFATLDVVVAGAEKLPADLTQAFEEKFGVRPVEGYGTTELSPLVSVNIPPSRSKDNFQADRKEGSVGRTIPGVTAKVTGEDGQELPVGQPGMLWIRGPNVMQGYMHQPELTAQVIKDGWYKTGDIAKIDEEGFIIITGRESRFSKIGGEMVPHIQIEEILCGLLKGQESDKQLVAVTAVPDEKKGERLIVLHTKLDIPIDDLRKGLSEAGLPNLFIPSTDSFAEVAELPVLGTGKLDLKGLKQAALARFAGG